MRAKAELTDETEQLEHIILQLQGETETIGEYVQLYQMQRQVLRRKHAEKDEYIARLARDREQMQDKLAQLQALVMQLLGEKNMLHSYAHAHQQSQQQLLPAGAAAAPSDVTGATTNHGLSSSALSTAMTSTPRRKPKHISDPQNDSQSAEGGAKFSLLISTEIIVHLVQFINKVLVTT